MRVYVANEALLIANTTNEKKYKKELVSLIDAAMYLIIEAARQGRYVTEFDPETEDAQLIDVFANSLSGMGYVYSNKTISWNVRNI